MWHEEAGVALAEAAKEVLETMCFVAAEVVPSAASAEPGQIAAQVEFRGCWTGRCLVEMPESCARVIAGNFAGVPDPNEVEPAVMIELLCEFTNMVCGNTITRLRCPGLVTLAPPHLIWNWPRSADPGGEPLFECWVDTGEGIVRVGFERSASS